MRHFTFNIAIQTLVIAYPVIVYPFITDGLLPHTDNIKVRHEVASNSADVMSRDQGFSGAVVAKDIQIRNDDLDVVGSDANGSLSPSESHNFRRELNSRPITQCPPPRQPSRENRFSNVMYSACGNDASRRSWLIQCYAMTPDDSKTYHGQCEPDEVCMDVRSEMRFPRIGWTAHCTRARSQRVPNVQIKEQTSSWQITVGWLSSETTTTINDDGQASFGVVLSEKNGGDHLVWVDQLNVQPLDQHKKPIGDPVHCKNCERESLAPVPQNTKWFSIGVTPMHKSDVAILNTF